MKGYFRPNRSGIIVIIVLLITAIGSMGITGCIPRSTVAAFQTYTDQNYGYSISYPGNWEKVSQDLLQAGEYVAFWDFKKGNGMPPYVSVAGYPATQNMSLVESFKAEIKSAKTDDRITLGPQNNVNVNGIPAIKHTMLMDHGDMSAKIMQIYLIHGNSSWVVTCMCSPTKYISYKSTFDEILASFTLTGASASSVPSTSSQSKLGKTLQVIKTQPSGQTTQSSGMVTHKDTANGYSVSVPDGWESLPRDNWQDTTIYGLRSLDTSEGKGAILMINKWIPPHKQSLQEDYDDLKSEFEKKNGYKFISEDHFSIAGIPAIKYVFQITFDQPTAFVMVFIYQGDTAWLINMTCVPVSALNTYKPIFDAIIDSFRITSSASASASMTTVQPTPSTSQATTSGIVFSTYTDIENGFSVRYPSDWQKAAQELLGDHEVVRFVGHQVSFNVSITGKADDVTLDQFCLSAEGELATYAGYQLISKSSITVDGLNARRYIFDMVSDGTNMSIMFVVLTRGDTAWMMTFATPVSLFNSYENTFNTIAGSLNI